MEQYFPPWTNTQTYVFLMDDENEFHGSITVLNFISVATESLGTPLVGQFYSQ